MKYFYICIVLFALFLSCNTKQDEYSDAIIFDTAISLDSLVDDYKIIELELKDSSCFTSLTQFVDVGFGFLIFDEIVNKLFLYDTTGKFLSNMLSKGQSAVEYSHIESVCCYDSLVYVSDCDNKTLVFDLNSSKVAKILPYFGHQIFKDTDTSFLSLNFISDDDDCYYVKRFNTDGKYLSSFYPMNINSGYIMSPKPYFYRVQDTIKFGLPFSDKLYYLHGDNSGLLHQFVLDGSQFPTTSMFQDYCANNTIIDFWRTDDKFVHFYIPFETSTHLVVYLRNAKSKWLGIYNKRIGQRFYSLIDANNSPFYPIVGVSDDYFVSNPSTEVLQKVSKYYKTNINPENSYLLFWKINSR